MKVGDRVIYIGEGEGGGPGRIVSSHYHYDVKQWHYVVAWDDGSKGDPDGYCEHELVVIQQNTK